MRNRYIVIFISILLTFSYGCGGEDFGRMDDFKVDFATVLRENNQLRFQFDDRQMVTPTNPETYSGGENGQRVIMNYTPLEDNRIRIRGISNIFTGKIRNEGFSEEVKKESVRVQSVWIGGDYLNMALEVQFHSTPHSVALYRDTESGTIDLYLSYTRNNDLPGNARILYASFLISELREDTESSVPIRIIINTQQGVREFWRNLRPVN